MIIPIIWHHLQVHQEPPHPPRLQEETWRTGGVLIGFVMLDLDETFTEASEWWSLSYDTSSKTPGRDLKDRWSLDKVSDVGYWWNFHRNFWRIIHIIWHQLLVHQESLQVHQEPPFSPRLQEETWRTMEFWWVSGVGSWWNLTWSHLLVHIQHACPIKDSTDSRWLQKDTWRKGGVYESYVLYLITMINKIKMIILVIIMVIMEIIVINKIIIN